MMHFTPPFLYKYKSLGNTQDLDRSLEIIEESRIYIPLVSMLNDPLEGKGVYPQSGFAGLSMSLALGKIPDRFNTELKDYRVLCLTETPVSPQMWAYYSGNYGGICLQFESLPFSLEPVRYAPTPYAVSELDVASLDSYDVNRARLLTKESNWSHELEWRSIFPNEEDTYVDLGHNNPTAVIIGHSCAADYKEKLALACEKKGISVYTTYIADFEFRIRIVPLGFEVKYDGKSLDNQIMEYCYDNSIRMFGEH